MRWIDDDFSYSSKLNHTSRVFEFLIYHFLIGPRNRRVCEALVLENAPCASLGVKKNSRENLPDGPRYQVNFSEKESYFLSGIVNGSEDIHGDKQDKIIGISPGFSPPLSAPFGTQVGAHF